ncbi:MAG: lactate utilization protein [Desulfobacteraceae bacterium]
MGDRERILARVREGLERDRGRDPGKGASPRPASMRPAAPAPAREVLVTRFCESCERESVEVHTAADAAEAGDRLMRILKTSGAERIFMWIDPVLAQPEIEGRIRTSNVVDLTPRQDHVDQDTFEALAARADVGITAADWALADTGTLVLLSSAGHSRSASLLPPVHVAVVPASRILSGLEDLVEKLPSDALEALQRESHVTLITGTSKTADIELSLVRGVHGPGTVHVIVIQDTEASQP